MESGSIRTSDGRYIQYFIMNNELILTIKDNRTAQIALDKDTLEALISDLQIMSSQLE